MNSRPVAILLSDQGQARDELDYHQARVLILICTFAQTRGKRLVGLTKLAKLDFLLRYPKFLERLLLARNLIWADGSRPTRAEYDAVESRVIRYKYGPWDDRYYPILGALVGRGLLLLTRDETSLVMEPTELGRSMARALAEDVSWSLTAARAELLASHFNLTGSRLKQLIYAELPDAIDRPIRTEI